MIVLTATCIVAPKETGANGWPYLILAWYITSKRASGVVPGCAGLLATSIYRLGALDYGLGENSLNHERLLRGRGWTPEATSQTIPDVPDASRVPP